MPLLNQSPSEPILHDCSRLSRGIPIYSCSVCVPNGALQFHKDTFAELRASTREGVNREKLTVKKIINNEMFFVTVYVPYKP